MRKLKYIGYSLLPMFLWLGIQVMVVAGFTFFLTAVWGILAGLGVEAGPFAAYMEKEYLSVVSILADAVFVICGYFWFRSLKRREIQDKSSRVPFSGKAWIRMFFLGIAAQFGTGIFLIIIRMLSPGTMETHNKVMESLGMFSPSVWSVLYTGVLAPVAEELLCRGLTLKILEKALPFWGANLLQALYFALIHGNLVQGAYAFCMGLVFGIVVRRYGTLKSSIFLHAIVNLSGVLLSNFYVNIFQRILIFLVLAVLVFVLREKREIGYSE